MNIYTQYGKVFCQFNKSDIRVPITLNKADTLGRLSLFTPNKKMTHTITKKTANMMTKSVVDIIQAHPVLLQVPVHFVRVPFHPPFIH